MQNIYDKDDGQEIKQPYAVKDLHVPTICSKLCKRRYMYKYTVYLIPKRFKRNNVNLKKYFSKPLSCFSPPFFLGVKHSFSDSKMTFKLRSILFLY